MGLRMVEIYGLCLLLELIQPFSSNLWNIGFLSNNKRILKMLTILMAILGLCISTEIDPIGLTTKESFTR